MEKFLDGPFILQMGVCGPFDADRSRRILGEGIEVEGTPPSHRRNDQEKDLFQCGEHILCGEYGASESGRDRPLRVYNQAFGVFR